MCMNIEITSIIFEICIVPEPATTPGTGWLLARDRRPVTPASSSSYRWAIMLVERLRRWNLLHMYDDVTHDVLLSNHDDGHLVS